MSYNFSTGGLRPQSPKPLTDQQITLLRSLNEGCTIYRTAYRYILLCGGIKVRNLHADAVTGLMSHTPALIQPINDQRCCNTWEISRAGWEVRESEAAK